MTDLRSKIENWILALTSEWNSRLYDQNRHVPNDQCYDLEGSGMEALNLYPEEHLESMAEDLELEDWKDAESLTDDKLEYLVNAAWTELCSPTTE